jgi:large subunit ribosomal protein L9
MEVILIKDVEKVGTAQSVVKVKDGFARNFLIPNKLAVPLTPDNLKRIEEEKKAKAAQLDKLKKECEVLKERLTGVSITITALKQEESDALYGSITAHDISKALKEEGFEVDKAKIELVEPIKALGIYEVPIKLHPEVVTKVKIWIVKK